MKNLLTLICICTYTFMQAQMTATFNKTVNTLCDGSDCNYTGPSIMINEIMVAPLTGDGSISGDDATRRGEWIELYNPNLCEPVDISCYYLGSSADQGGTMRGEGFQLPANTIVPANGFCVVRGVNAVAVPSNLLVANGGNTVEVVVPGNITGDGICVDGGISATRLWFPNAGGWFAFYDAAGVPQDAISWGLTTGMLGVAPCVPQNATCTNSVSSLSNYNNIPASRKEFVYSGTVNPTGNSIRRVPDGGSWMTNSGATPTPGDCNDICAQVSSTTCDGIATVNISGGSGSYTYLWDDSQTQMTQTATGLCEGTYTVIVTDQVSGDVQTFTVNIVDTVLVVNFALNDELCDYGQTVPINNISTYSPIPTSGQTGEFSGTGVNGNNFDVAVSGDGTFQINYKFTDEHGCTNSDSANLIVHELPQPQILGLSPGYCMADSIVDLTLSPLGGVLFGPGISNSQFNINNAGVGTHTIQYAVENQYGCKDTATVTVEIHALPTFDLNNTPPNCGQNDGEIIITPNAGDYPFSYSINDGANTQNDSTFSNLPGGSYVIVVSDDNGCKSSIDTTLNTNGATDASFTFADFCEGQNNGATDIASTNGIFSFVPPATDGATIDSITGIISNGVGGTTYTVQHVTPGICPDTAIVNVTVNIIPIMDFEADTTEGMPPLPVVFTNNSTGANDYTWIFGDGSTDQNNDIYTSHTFYNEGVYITQLIGENNMCTDTAEIKIIVIFPPIKYTFPNIFTPNGDNSNDNFKFATYENIKSLHIIILNRWGNLVFESDDINFHWNGKVKNAGGECVEGVYFYKADLENYKGEEIKEHGFIHLVRN